MHKAEQENNVFSSNVAKDLFGTITPDFMANKFTFHSPSEHTINGKHYDLEMQIEHEIVHNVSDPGIVTHAMIALVFSVEEYNKKIST